MRKFAHTLALSLAAAVLTVLPAGLVFAHTATHGQIEIIHPWVEPTTGPVTMAHPTIANNGDRPIMLIAISTVVGHGAVFVVDGEDVPNVVVPAGDILAPGDFSIRLEGLATELAEGAHFPVTLLIENMEPFVFHMVVGENVEMPMMEMMEMGGAENMPMMQMNDGMPMPSQGKDE